MTLSTQGPEGLKLLPIKRRPALSEFVEGRVCIPYTLNRTDSYILTFLAVIAWIYTSQTTPNTLTLDNMGCYVSVKKGQWRDFRWAQGHPVSRLEWRWLHSPYPVPSTSGFAGGGCQVQCSEWGQGSHLWAPSWHALA